jgi:large subunit ribosomal protein L6
MSRIGKLPIPLTSEVKIAVKGDVVDIKGPKGSLSHAIPAGISVKNDDGNLVVSRKDESKQQRSLHGLVRSLLANAVEGVTKGFSKQLEIHGVGYRAQVKGSVVNFTLGYTHPIDFPIPDGIDIAVTGNKIKVSGYDRQQVGQVSAEIRALRKPDVYKQKGIRYTGEKLRKKAGKSGVS